MSKFKKKAEASQEIPTSSLPDIIFMLLFFFMVTTVLREQEIRVEQRIPRADQLRKLEKKSLVSHLYIGKPKPQYAEIYGTEPKIQINDVFINPEDVVRWVNEEKDNMDELERDQITISLKVDTETKMGIISDVQQQLRDANARKIMYSSIKSEQEE